MYKSKSLSCTTGSHPCNPILYSFAEQRHSSDLPPTASTFAAKGTTCPNVNASALTQQPASALLTPSRRLKINASRGSQHWWWTGQEDRRLVSVSSQELHARHIRPRPVADKSHSSFGKPKGHYCPWVASVAPSKLSKRAWRTGDDPGNFLKKSEKTGGKAPDGSPCKHCIASAMM